MHTRFPGCNKLQVYFQEWGDFIHQFTAANTGSQDGHLLLKFDITNVNNIGQWISDYDRSSFIVTKTTQTFLHSPIRFKPASI